MSTKIEWTDFTWNPVRGCTRVSEGCRNCYAERQAARGMGPYANEAYAKSTEGGPRWTGRVELVESKLTEPLHKPSWRGKRVFVNSMSDLFHESLPDEAIDRVFAVMALSPDVTYQVVTKRAERMARWFDRPTGHLNNVISLMTDRLSREIFGSRYAGEEIPFFKEVPNPIVTRENGRWPLPNVWLMVSAEDQPTADERIPYLLKTPAAVRGVSYEPALGPVDFTPWIKHLDWIIAGGESGPGARPAHPDWFRSARDQCAEAGTAFFFKQWGEWAPDPEGLYSELPDSRWGTIDRAGGFCYGGDNLIGDPGIVPMARVGKRNAGRLLDEREHSEFPR